MRILAIETSCDETAVAVLESDGRVFHFPIELVSSQVKDHAPFGGVIPELAARRHIDNLFPMLEQSGVPRTGKKIDAVAVTFGPGLVPALRIGVEVARTMALLWGKPLVAVNHLEGHIYSAFIEDDSNRAGQTTLPLRLPDFPALCLLVSGGHTELVLMKDHGAYEHVGMTRDDAAGEAFDKVAKMLGLGYPGGPRVAEAARTGHAEAVRFPRPMLESHDFDFSFSGLKTAVMIYLKEHGAAAPQAVADICASFQEAVVDVLVSKTLRAVNEFKPRSLLLAGGVSANTRLRTELAYALKRDAPQVVPFFAPLKYTGDNAAMVALAGYFRAVRRQFTDPLLLQADPQCRLV